jgi:aspartate aminotransferase
MFEEGKKLSALYGEENVYDFSLGNPSVEPPAEIKSAILELLETQAPNVLHGYMNNSGYEEVRDQIANSINRKFNTKFTEQNLVMTVGAASGLNIILKTLLNPGDEVIVFAPYFGEYNNYVSNFDGQVVVIPADINTFEPNLEMLKAKITAKTKAVIINTPNNPTGVVYSDTALKNLAELLNKKQQELNTSIYLISDEPYREIVYDNITVPYLTKYYKNTFVVYSFSKSLSLPGERIGYALASSEMDDFDMIIQALNVANRILGYVNAPSLFQKVVAKCIDANVDISVYEKNKTLLYDSLIKFGYDCVKPDGTFYLFPKSLCSDDKAFAQEAKKFNLLIVPGSAFSCPGHFRIAYCVPYKKVEDSLESFEKLAKLYL